MSEIEKMMYELSGGNPLNKQMLMGVPVNDIYNYYCLMKKEDLNYISGVISGMKGLK